MVSSFPGLFAAAHVLLRLLAPRHPPCALSLLIMKNTVVAAMEFSRCTHALNGALSLRKAGREAGLSKLNSVDSPRSTFVLGESDHRTAKVYRGARLKPG